MQLSDFKTYVKQDWKRTDKDTELVQAYNDMINWVAMMMPHSGYKFQSYINLVSGTEEYPIPSTLTYLIHPIKFIIGTGASDSGYKLKMLTKEEYDRHEPNPNRSSPHTGRPWAYTVFGRCILITPPADSSDSLLEIDWTKKTTDQSADSDTPSLGEEWDEVLKQGTLERLYSGIGMTDEARFWGEKYHVVDRSNDIPVGLAAKLFDAEKDLEGEQIGYVKPTML